MLILCGVAAGPLFSLGWLVGGATRESYDPTRHPISSLAMGEAGWTQTVTFVLAGLLTLASAVGLHGAVQSRRDTADNPRAPWAVVAIGIGLLGAGAFVTDPLNGYPLGTPNLPEQYSVPGRLHRLFSALVFFGFPIASYRFGRLFGKWGQRRWAVYSILTCITLAVTFTLTNVAFAQLGGLANYAGLLQRLTLTIGWAWLTLLAIHAWTLSFASATKGGR